MIEQFYDSMEERMMLLLDQTLKTKHYYSMKSLSYEGTDMNKMNSFIFNNENDNHDEDDEDDENDENDDDVDMEITGHHRERKCFKHLNWDQSHDFIDKMGFQTKNRYECRQGVYFREKLLFIRQQLSERNFILRPVYKGTGYHLEPRSQFQKKTTLFMKQTPGYLFLFKLHRSCPETTQNYLVKIVEEIELKLKYFLSSNSISEKQYDLMKIDRSTVRLNYLYFVSQTHKEGVPVQPIMICNDGPTTGISNFLGHLLGSLFNEVTYCKHFPKPIDVIYEMENYEKNGQLKPTTLFASFNIDDLCLTFSHDRIMEALENFLNSFLFETNHFHGITSQTILELVRLVLDNQYFICNYNFYQQIAGGASGSSLTIPLVYIYLFYWQPNLLNDLIDENELFFRYRDEAFITWNRSEHELRTILSNINDTFPQPIWHITRIDTTITFQDIKLTNRQGILRTGIHRFPHFNSLMLPSLIQLVEHFLIKDTWKCLRKDLLKAVRYCTNEINFIQAKLDILTRLDSTNISREYLVQATCELEEDFRVRLYQRSMNRSNYEIIRQNVLDYDQVKIRKNQMKKQTNQQQMETFYIDYISNKNKFHYQQPVNDIYKEFPYHKNNISNILIDEFLIKKRPDICYLELPD